MGNKLDSCKCISFPNSPSQIQKHSSLRIMGNETPKRDNLLSASTIDDEYISHHKNSKNDYIDKIDPTTFSSLNIGNKSNEKPVAKKQSFSLVKNMIPLPAFDENQTKRNCCSINLKNFKIVRQMKLDAYKGKTYLVSKTNEQNVLYVMTVNIKNKSLISYEEILGLKGQILEKSCPFLLKINFCLANKMKYYIFQRYCPFSDLDSKLQTEITLTESQAKIYLAQIIIALENLPYNLRLIESIIHFLTLRTVLLSEKGHVVLNVLSIYLKNMCIEDGNNFPYYPPEYFSNSMHNSSFSSILAWKIGIMLYKMIFGLFPFPFIENAYKKSKSECYHDEKELPNNNLIFPPKVINFNWNLRFSRIFSLSAIEFISKLLIKDPDRRLGNKSIADLKKHSFFQEIDFDKIQEMYSKEKCEYQNENKFEESLAMVHEIEEDQVWN
jgi:hypothetical protein